ncbi:hypothetical protein CXF80_10100 [Shewanella sp. Actino-trap-3]|uniref:hypothetical protein n=1 Tax=Shewanella sp. Actino-trap-3 TaxID=2058331 RepID=UPI000C320BA3|nr:hypothetical protein [Shewanella sp. Actino-trap-3]PKG78638.1 hypothetical protein CXF80_10100 [Shewanella sp. Actino-trap-3]
MTFIKALGAQWNKGKLSQQLEQVLMLEPEIQSLFIGATTVTTVANLIAAIGFRDSETQALPLGHEFMLTILFDCFRLLMIKQIEHDNLSQAEHLIIQLTKIWATKDLGDKPVNESRLTQYRALQQQILKLTEQLDELNRQRLLQKRNM